MKRFFGKIGLTGRIDAQTPPFSFVPRCGDVGHANLAASEFLQLFNGQLYGRICCGADAENNKRFFQIEMYVSRFLWIFF